MPSPPHAPQCQPISACSSAAPSEREGEGAREAGVCSSFQLTDHERVPSHRKRLKPLLGFKETISPKYNEQTVPIPPESLGKGRHPSAVVGKKAILMDVMTSHEPTHLSWSDSAPWPSPRSRGRGRGCAVWLRHPVPHLGSGYRPPNEPRALQSHPQPCEEGKSTGSSLLSRKPAAALPSPGPRGHTGTFLHATVAQ